MSRFSQELMNGCSGFDCGNEDLNEFFMVDSFKYDEQLLGRTYCFHIKEDKSEIVAIYTVSNHALKVSDLPGSRKRKLREKIPREKHFSTIPAVLIGRLGVNLNYRGLKIGSDVMDFIKSWFSALDNKTGCRFIVVDSYNDRNAMNFYERNGFQTTFSDENQEKKYWKRDQLSTRSMQFDLLQLET